MDRETIFIDIDETAARTVEDWVYPIVNSAYWTNFHHDTTLDYRDVFWDRIHENWAPIPLARKIEIFNWAVLKDRWQNRIRPVAWSVEKILELSETFNIEMLTARHSMLTEYTPEWVRRYFGKSVGRVLFSDCYHGGKKRKSDICKEEWAGVMIEDDMDYALELASEGIFVFLLKKPWNSHRSEVHRNIRRIDSWAELK